MEPTTITLEITIWEADKADALMAKILHDARVMNVTRIDQ